MHIIPCNGRSNHKSNGDEYDKFFRKQVDNITCGGTQYFADANFFYSLHCHEGCKPVQSKTTQENCDGGKNFIQLRQLVFLFVETGDLII